MADEINQPSTHVTDLKGRFRVETSAPDDPVEGDIYYNTSSNYLMRYNGTDWKGVAFKP